MNSDQLKRRTKSFALRVINLVAELPRGPVGDTIGRQVLRSGTSIGSNYREALRASTRRQFVSILEIVLRETDETLYWLELIGEANLMKPSRLEALKLECNEMIAIFVSTVRTTKKNLPQNKNPNRKGKSSI